MKVLNPSMLLLFICSVELNAASLTLSLPQFLIFPDPEHTLNASIIRQEYFVLDDSKWKAAQCSVWLNNDSGQDENVYVGIISESKTYWTRLQLNESSFAATEKNISDSLSEFIKKNAQDKASFTVWNVQLQPGVNHLSVDFGLNNFSNQPNSEMDTTTWKLGPVISNHTHSEMKVTIRIILQNGFKVLSFQPSAGWAQADSFLRCNIAQNFDSAEVSYAFSRTSPSLNANEVSWEAAFQQLQILSQKNLTAVFWKPLMQPATSASQIKSSWLLVLILPVLVIVFILLKKEKPT